MAYRYQQNGKVRRGPCSECLPGGGAIFDRTYSSVEGSTWVCRNCGKASERRVRSRHARLIQKLTQGQAR